MAAFFFFFPNVKFPLTTRNIPLYLGWPADSLKYVLDYFVSIGWVADKQLRNTQLSSANRFIDELGRAAMISFSFYLLRLCGLCSVSFVKTLMMDLTRRAAYSVFRGSMCESRLQVMVLRLLEFNHCSGVQVIPAQHQVKIECLDQTTWCHLRFFCLTSNCLDCSLNCTSALGTSFK